jgi:hypothetical protein
MKACRVSRDIAPFILNLSTTSPPGCFILGERAHSTHWIGGGGGLRSQSGRFQKREISYLCQEANLTSSGPYPSQYTDYKCFVRFQKKWNQLNADLASCHATKLHILTSMYLAVTFAMHRHHLPWTWREQLSLKRWPLCTKPCITFQNVTISGAFPPPPTCLCGIVLNPLQTMVNLNYVYSARTVQ